jgi:hypothetical protein
MISQMTDSRLGCRLCELCGHSMQRSAIMCGYRAVTDTVLRYCLLLPNAHWASSHETALFCSFPVTIGRWFVAKFVAYKCNGRPRIDAATAMQSISTISACDATNTGTSEGCTLRTATRVINRCRDIGRDPHCGSQRALTETAAPSLIHWAALLQAEHVI